jgi:putative DNA primase/helicase
VGSKRIAATHDDRGPVEVTSAPGAARFTKGARQEARHLHQSPTAAAAEDIAVGDLAAIFPGEMETRPLEQKLADCAGLDHSDTDNGKRLIEYFGGDLLVRRERNTTSGSWLHWDGCHWDLDNGAAGAAILCQKVGDLIMEEARFIEPTEAEQRAIDEAKVASRALEALGKSNDERTKAKIHQLTVAIGDGEAACLAVERRRAAHRKHGLATKNRSRMIAMLECAGPHLRRSPDDFNADPLLVVTSTHTLRFVQRPDPDCPDPDGVRMKWVVEAEPLHCRSDLVTAMVPVAYDPVADCPEWRRNLERFQPNAEQRRTLQQFSGLGLLGKQIQRLMFHYGTGGNFKSVFLECVTRVLGDSYAIGLPTESIIGGNEASAGGARPDLERVFGKRMLRILELPEGARLKADLIKKLTGGERWPVRTLYKSFFEFTPIAKTHMSGNSFPEFDGSDGGMRRRLLVVEWPVTISESEQRDFDVVVGELMCEAPGILNWLIEGALDYLTNGLVVSDETRAVTQDYFDEMDPLARFVRDCVNVEPGQTVKARDMYLAYKAHCAANARHPVYEARFGRVMKKKFKQDEKARVRTYLDVKLHDVPTLDEQQDTPPPNSSSPSRDEWDDYVDF